ncbi:glutathione S-transferase family protein [Sphingosinicella humi]|uniref:Glutathione S-transferase n=1 Tax=Allosphingosinicella humi TaxID=2068657 RepID=A0A2U2J160_9SPHN|nr:glutathione S-transferase family protein [Sphingosinicella humi]PWG02054.1 glutathione S-transferase [Sphingosinicella humi]
MIVYGSSLSPFVRKVLVYGAEKGIELELKPTRLGSDEAEFREASPFGKIPAFRDGDFTLADSTAIVTYLEAIKPEPELVPTEPKARARTIWFDEFADTILFGCGSKMFFNRIVAPRFLGRAGDLDEAETAEREELPPILDYLERTIPDSGWLVEDRLTLADISVASPFANFRHLGIDVDATQRPKLAAFVDNILSRPSFSGWLERETAFLARTA